VSAVVSTGVAAVYFTVVLGQSSVAKLVAYRRGF
jgi:hypothetical protein